MSQADPSGSESFTKIGHVFHSARAPVFRYYLAPRNDNRTRLQRSFGVSEFSDIEKQISSAMRADQFRLRRFLKSIRNAQRSGKPFDRNLEKLRTQLSQSCQRLEQRRAGLPQVTYPSDLPVVERKDEIAAAIRDHQVVVVCGETGSGKSTQLPKIALELGRGIGGVIGHTQPRRIAARSVAVRIAEELGCDVGRQVGYRVRFNDSSGPNTLIRLMTDGIMLAETQTDRFLDQYDTIIVDEAHERSLNIDFLLGYLKRLLLRRRDLRVIITSATIDADRFAQHFGSTDSPAPIITVEGRTYPVEVRYQPPNASRDDDSGPRSRRDEERDTQDAIVAAVKELANADNGHILVFLPTERDIRETARRLGGIRYPGDTSASPTQIVPLFGRLSMADQAKVFRPYNHRRIVLATNVAESSLTVPGIRAVVDTGTARISRYSARSRMQRLPIEPVSQASARQRAGRCGRVGPGICIRLFDEQDYEDREAFTPPEIQRTNLASVILRTINLRLGRLDEFPFIDPPRPTTVREGYRTLEELQAIERVDGSSETDFDVRLTETGRRMAMLPVEPRISRMILAAIEEQAVPEVLVIASALEIQDPRERPVEHQQAADEAHAEFVHEDSDFLTLLNLWDAWHDRRKLLSGSQLRKWCRSSFLSWLRMREWVDIHRQLKDLLHESGDKTLKQAAAFHPVKDRRGDVAAIHRSILAGLLTNVGYRSAEREYTGAGNSRLTLWPGSTLARKSPRWFVAAELVETSQRFARVLGRVQPEWVERVGEHLLVHEHSEPHWDAGSGNIMCFRKSTLFGLPVVARRRVTFAPVDPVKSRELLIQFGLVELGLFYGHLESESVSEFEEEERLLEGARSRLTPGQIQPGKKKRRGWARDFPFLLHNIGVLDEVRQLQARTRRHDLMPSDDVLFNFYDRQIPAEVCDRQKLRKWFQRTVRSNPGLLRFELSHFTNPKELQEGSEYPSHLECHGMSLPLSYQLDPGRDADGVTISVPAEGLGLLHSQRLTWLVPGLVEQKVTELIRSLPREQRRQFIPAPDTARQLTPQLKHGEGSLYSQLADLLTRYGGNPVQPEDFQLTELPEFLRFNVRVVDDSGKTIEESRNLEELRNRVAGTAAATAPTDPQEKKWKRSGITFWDFDAVPEKITLNRAGLDLPAFPAIKDDGLTVSLTLCQTQEEAHATHRRGLRKLFLLEDLQRIQRQIDNLPGLTNLKQQAVAIRMDLPSQLKLLLVERAYLSPPGVPRTKQQWDQWQSDGRGRVAVVVQEIVTLVPALFKQHRETRRHLLDSRGPGWDLLLRDMYQQLDALINPWFLSTTPWHWLIQVPRYLTCIRMRLDRLTSGGLQKELDLFRDFMPYQTRYHQRMKHKGHRVTPMLDHYRWMLEEFRVSLFAQKLGTAIKISGVKLNEQWARTG